MSEDKPKTIGEGLLLMATGEVLKPDKSNEKRQSCKGCSEFPCKRFEGFPSNDPRDFPDVAKEIGCSKRIEVA